MGKNDNNVRKALGKEAWDILIEKTKEGGIGSQHMKDVSLALHPIVGGNHRRRVDELKVMCDDHELREILADWWDQELHGLNQTEALRNISDILSSPEVTLPYIASSLRHCLDFNISDTILKYITEMSENEPLLSEDHRQRIKEIVESIQDPESSASKSPEEAYKLIELNFKLVMENFKSNNRIALQIVEQVEDETASSFQLPMVKKFVFGDQTVTVCNRDKKMQEVKDSRLKLLIMQILENLNNKRRVSQVISEFNMHIAAYEELEENIILQTKAKVDQEEKKALRAEKEAAEEALQAAIEKLQSSIKDEKEDQDQQTRPSRPRKPRLPRLPRRVQHMLKRVNPVNWPAPAVPLWVGNTFQIFTSENICNLRMDAMQYLS